MLLISSNDTKAVVDELKILLLEYPKIRMQEKRLLDNLLQVIFFVDFKFIDCYESKLSDSILLLTDKVFIDKITLIVRKYQIKYEFFDEEIDYRVIAKKLSIAFPYIRFKTIPPDTNKMQLFNNDIQESRVIDGLYGIYDDKIVVELFINKENNEIVNKVDEYNLSTTFTKIIVSDYVDNRLFALKVEYNIIELSNDEIFLLLKRLIDTLLNVLY